MRRLLFSEEHELFRRSVRSFIEREVLPHQERWIEAGIVDRDLWLKAGEAGLLCPWVDEQYGGPGGDFLHSCVVTEELATAYEHGFSAGLHSDIVAPYIDSYGTEQQKQCWLPRFVSGEVVTAIAMTEPGAGSDLTAIATTARRDGSSYVLNGAKTFISNGILCDLCLVAAKTDPNADNVHESLSLFLVEAETVGFTKSKRLNKIGWHAQDTAELVFEDCRVPESHLLGELGAGFLMMMQKLQQERLCVSVGVQAMAERVLRDTIAYTQERVAFGRPISKMQNTRFKLAECATKVEVGRSFLDRVIQEHMVGESLVKECSMAKLWQTEMLGEVVDECLQLFGGYGYMTEYPISRAYVDARVQRIFAGTNEIMKTIIAKQMGL